MSADYQILISQDASEHRVNESILRLAVEAALLHHGAPAAEIDVAIVNDREIARLNEAHLGYSGPTDVLSFDLRETTGDALIDGQIVLSIDTALREAQARAHTIDAEAALYAVHGVLHLLGYDDATEPGAAKMHQLEDQILEKVGLGVAFSSTRK
jgi:probable rRNA maturation factor